VVTPRDFPVADLEAAICQHTDGVARPIPSLFESWKRIPEFRRALLRWFAGASRTPIKSSQESGFDFYHDLIVRHKDSARVAVILPGATRDEIRAVSFAELHAACTQRCTAWQESGVKAGQTICIVGAFSVDWVVALLSALRLGLLSCILPANGPDYLRVRLQRVRPDYVATASHYRRILPAADWVGALLPDSFLSRPPSTLQNLGSHTYEADQAVFALYSPLRAAQAEPLSLSAADSYVAAVRDGLLLWRIGPGSTLCVPDENLLEQQPALLLTTLLCGGTYLHTLPNPPPASGVVPQSPQVLFVRRALRDRMLDQPRRALPGLQLWVVHPAEAADARWQDFADHVGIQNVPAMAAWVDAAAAGCLLFSPPQRGRPSRAVWPAPGIAHALQTAGDPPLPARSGSGVLRVPQDDAAALGIRLIAWDAAFAYGGPVEVLHRGERYPFPEVEACVGKLPFVDAAVALGAVGDRSEPALFVFVGPEPLAVARELEAARISAVREQIAQCLGPAFVPTLIQVFAMYPRRSNGSVDRLWLTRAYNENMLREREEHPLFRLLDELRSSWGGPVVSAPPAASTSESRHD